MSFELDEIDKALLRVLQRNAGLTAEKLGEVVGLSSSQAGRRRARLEAEGFVRSYGAKLEPERLGLGVQGFVQVAMQSHGADTARAFGRLVELRPEIVGAWTLTGEADYLLRVYCTDLGALNALIHDVLLRHPSVARVHSQIVMDQLKTDAPLPL
ncbi:MAG: Lrp/AsnC family transcriptional regulator [Brevirhabdus sp.]